MTNPCGVHLQVRHVITKVSGRVSAKDLPTGHWYYVAALAVIFDVSRRRIWNVLSDYRHELDPPAYRLIKLRRHRIVGPDDFDRLQAIFSGRVKQKSKDVTFTG